MEKDSVIADIGLQLGLTETPNSEVKIELLAEKINELLTRDFQKLISILYRMDVNETKLRRLLDENRETDAGLIIANLMVERQLLKIRTRRASKSTKQRDNNIDE